jgi:hypothetical protein
MTPPSPHLGVHLWNKQDPFDTIPGTNFRLPGVDKYLRAELGKPELDSVYYHLWIAGLRRQYIKPLHHQRVLRRDIVVSERMHLISRGNINTSNLFPLVSCTQPCMCMASATGKTWHWVSFHHIYL